MSEIFDFGESAYLPGGEALVLMADNRNLTVDGDYPTTPVIPTNKNSVTKLPREVKFVQWGRGNRLPLDILEKVYKNVTTSANIEFNSRLGVGNGIMVYRQVREGNKLVPQEVLESEYPDVFDFLRKVNYNGMVSEMVADISVFGDSPVEIDITKQGNKVAFLRHREMCYSRLSETNADGAIEWHGYSAGWHKGKIEDVVVTPFLDRRTPYMDILRRLGKEPDEKGNTRDNGQRRFVMSMAQSVPGRFYYNKPYWWSIFEAGWYDFACSIPEFKRALLTNQMSIKWQVHINTKFWTKHFKSLGIDTLEDKIKERTDYLEKLNDFLAGHRNAGKSITTEFEYDFNKGVPLEDIRIEAVDSQIKGGEYISDSEEVSNIICYAMGVHPSLIGANPGKNGTISGSEARELFIIKQALLKPVRDALVLPLYVTKYLNGWPADIHFCIPNLVLMTLDKGTGAEKSIGNEPV